MAKATTREAEVLLVNQNLEALVRRRVLEAFELALDDDLTKALGECGLRLLESTSISLVVDNVQF